MNLRTRIEADRHVGAGRARGVHQARIVFAEPVGAGQQPQRRGGVGRSAANAGGDRQQLGQAERAEGKTRNARGKLAGGAEHEVVRPSARRLRRGADDFERERGGGRERQRVAGAGEGDEAFQFVIAVDARRPSTCSVRLILAGARVVSMTTAIEDRRAGR